MSEQSTRVLLGRINGLYGIRGWVKIFSYTSPITNILNYSPWQLCIDGQWQTITVCEGKAHGKSIIARFESIDDRNKAARLLDANIAVTRSQLPQPPEDEYYWVDLIGLTVINREGVTLGKVDHLLKTGSNDVLVIQGERERLVPFLLKQVVLDVDLAQGVLHVDWDADF
jgi:16S rRNA processing protein RimM